MNCSSSSSGGMTMPRPVFSGSLLMRPVSPGTAGKKRPGEPGHFTLFGGNAHAWRRAAHPVIHLFGEAGEILGEHGDQALGLAVIGILVLPGATRIEQLVVDA